MFSSSYIYLSPSAPMPDGILVSKTKSLDRTVYSHCSLGCLLNWWQWLSPGLISVNIAVSCEICDVCNSGSVICTAALFSLVLKTFQCLQILPLTTGLSPSLSVSTVSCHDSPVTVPVAGLHWLSKQLFSVVDCGLLGHSGFQFIAHKNQNSSENVNYSSTSA